MSEIKRIGYRCPVDMCESKIYFPKSAMKQIEDEIRKALPEVDYCALSKMLSQYHMRTGPRSLWKVEGNSLRRFSSDTEMEIWFEDDYWVWRDEIITILEIVAKYTTGSCYARFYMDGQLIGFELADGKLYRNTGHIVWARD